MGEPTTVGPPVRVREGEDLRVSSSFQAGYEIVNLLTAPFCGTGHDELPRSTLGTEHTLDDRHRRIGAVLDDEDHLECLVVLANQSTEVLF